MKEKNIDILFDSHCHPQFPHYDKDRNEMIKRAQDEGVFMVCVGTDLKTSKQGIELANQYENVWATAGLHPNDDLNEEFNPDAYENLLNSKKVVGFGEIGLDYYRTKKNEDQELQKNRFRKQLELAVKINKPLVIHCRDAHSDLFEIIKNYAIRGVIHSFTGTLEEAKKYLDRGFYFGFNGIITFANQYDEIVKYVPLKNILLETDAPYLTPLPFRRERNEPIYIKYVAQKIAELKSLSYSQIAEKTFENTKKAFQSVVKEVYLDNAATTPCDPKTIKKMTPFGSKVYGNPSSFNDAGREAKKVLEQSRHKISRLIGAKNQEIVFTSSATEANNLAVLGTIKAFENKNLKIITTSIEHQSVLEPIKKLGETGAKILYLSVNKEGLVDLNDFKKALTQEAVLISIIYANNEIGSIQPIKKIAKIIKEFKRGDSYPYFHVDASQATNYQDINVNNLGVDLMTLSSHKIYGPKGIAALYIRKGVEIKPLIYGGGQEFNLRSGTEATPLVAGFANALEEAEKSKLKNRNSQEKLRSYFIQRLKKLIPSVKINGPENSKDRLPNIINIVFPEIENEQLLIHLDKYGIRASAGSACSSHDIEPSYVLTAIGLTKKEARSSIRFSLGKQISKADLDYVLKTIPKVVKRIEELYPKDLKKHYYAR